MSQMERRDSLQDVGLAGKFQSRYSSVWASYTLPNSESKNLGERPIFSEGVTVPNRPGSGRVQSGLSLTLELRSLRIILDLENYEGNIVFLRSRSPPFLTSLN